MKKIAVCFLLLSGCGESAEELAAQRQQEIDRQYQQEIDRIDSRQKEIDRNFKSEENRIKMEKTRLRLEAELKKPVAE
jgi:Tfp pilus assembly protein PilP